MEDPGVAQLGNKFLKLAFCQRDLLIVARIPDFIPCAAWRPYHTPTKLSLGNEIWLNFVSTLSNQSNNIKCSLLTMNYLALVLVFDKPHAKELLLPFLQKIRNYYPIFSKTEKEVKHKLMNHFKSTTLLLPSHSLSDMQINSEHKCLCFELSLVPLYFTNVTKPGFFQEKSWRYALHTSNDSMYISASEKQFNGCTATLTQWEGKQNSNQISSILLQLGSLQMKTKLWLHHRCKPSRFSSQGNVN